MVRLRTLATLIGLDGLVAACGVGLIVYGVGLVYEPAAFVSAGGFLLALALWRL